MIRVTRTIGFVFSVLLVAADLASAQTLYGVTGAGGSSPSSLYTVNTSTGATTVVGATGFPSIGSLSLSPGGVLYGVSNSGGGGGAIAAVFARPLLTINTTTGLATPVGSTNIDCNVADIAFRSDGALFAADGCGGFWTINTTTGAATVVGSLSSGSPHGGGLAFNSVGTLYLADEESLYTVNTATAVTTLVGTLSGLTFGDGSRAPGMKFHPTTGALFMTVFQGSEGPGSPRLGSASTLTGTVSVTDVGSTGVPLEAIAFGVFAGPVIPTLPPWGLAGLGIVLAALAAWTLVRSKT